MEKEKKSIWKKMAGFLGAAVMAAGLLVSTPVHAASYVYGPYIDGVQPYGTVGYSSAAVSAYTQHKIHEPKSVTLTAYASVYGVNMYYGTVTNTGSDSDTVTANISMQGSDYGVGGKATHTVRWWSKNTEIGYYVP